MARLNYYSLSGDLAKKYSEFSQLLANKPALKGLKELVTIRASQLNGCAFCVDMHVKEAKINEERELRVHHIAIWHESPLFSAREKAALEWTEILTNLPKYGVPDQVYQRMLQHFTEQELSDLTFLIVSINGWNRLGVAFRSAPGSADLVFGLDKAGLS
ncbi:MAG TPA: carboxymuconolactone decarboxylase family protein [Burkholderiaceae bacterium]|nr:carboxymuconolactone decarboxylase family protein [Burkholderiaceae bacterium]